MRVCTRPTFRSQLCARSEVQCAESPFLSVHLCITYACNVLCATFCVQCTACSVLCAKYLRTACRRVGTKPSPSAGYVYGCMFAQLCTQPFHSIFNFIRYRIFTTALLPTGNTYDCVTISVIRYRHVPPLLIIIHCVVTCFTN